VGTKKRSDFTFIFTPDDSLVPAELDPNEDENVSFSFSNFSTHFDEHINKSIRGYSDLRNDVVSISKYFVEEDTNVLDIGCSQGSLLRRMMETNDHVSTTNYIGVEVNDDFKPHWEETENLKYVVDDITTMEFPSNLSFVTSLFTFQFIPERHRLTLMKKIYDNLVEGGSFVFSEKVLSISGKIQNMMEFIYYDYKRQNFSEKQILDKETELRHLAKLTNEDLLIKQLLGIGFRSIQPFWRNHNFVGYIALKLPSKVLEIEE
jgi:tRNA (cmo5U34)-methyltransferase